MIRDNLIRCGVGLPVKDDYTYEELFNLSEEIDQILWYYRVLAIANSRDKLKDFIFPMDRTYVSYMRNVFYKEYCESKKDRREVTISGLVPNTDVGYEYRDIDEEEVLEKSFEDSEDSEEGTTGTDSSNSENSESSEIEGTNYDLTDEDLDEIWGSGDSWGTDAEDSESDSTEPKSSVDEIKNSVNTDKTDIEQADSNLKELQDSVIYVTMDMLEIDEKGFYVYSTEDDEDAEEVDPFEDDSNDTLWEDEDEPPKSIKNMDEISATDDSEDDFPDRDFDEENEDSGSDTPNDEEDEDDIFSSWGDDEPDENVDDVENEEDVDDVDFPDNGDIEDDEDDIPDNDEEDDVDFPEDTVEDENEDDLFSSWGNEDNEDDEDFPSNDVDDEEDGDFPSNAVDDEEEDFPDLSDEDEDIPDNGDSEDVDEDEDDFPDLDSEDDEDSDDAEDFPDWNDEDNQDNDNDDIDFSDWDEDQDDEDEEKVKHSVNKNKGSIKGDKPTPSKKDGVGSKGIKSSEGVQDSFEHTRDEQFVESFDKVINGTLNFGRKSGKKIINKIWKGMTNQE